MVDERDGGCGGSQPVPAEEEGTDLSLLSVFLVCLCSAVVLCPHPPPLCPSPRRLLPARNASSSAPRDAPSPSADVSPAPTPGPEETHTQRGNHTRVISHYFRSQIQKRIWLGQTGSERTSLFYVLIMAYLHLKHCVIHIFKYEPLQNQSKSSLHNKSNYNRWFQLLSALQPVSASHSVQLQL